MKVNVQSVNFNAESDLIGFVENKLNKLDARYDKIISAEVFFKVQQTRSPENKITEILLSVPGDEIIVKKITEKFEEGVDEGIQVLKRSLKKRKEKQSAVA